MRIKKNIREIIKTKDYLCYTESSDFEDYILHIVDRNFGEKSICLAYRPADIFQIESSLFMNNVKDRICFRINLENEVNTEIFFQDYCSCPIKGQLNINKEILFRKFSNNYSKIDDFLYSFKTNEIVWKQNYLTGYFDFGELFINDQDLKLLTKFSKKDGSKQWEFDYSNYIHFEDENSRWVNFDIFTIYENQIICGANGDAILSIDNETGVLLWEHCGQLDSNNNFRKYTFHSNSFVLNKEGNKLFALGRAFHEFDLESHQIVIRKDWHETKEFDFSVRAKVLNNNKIICTGSGLDISSSQNKVGIFNTETLVFEWQLELPLPNGAILNHNPVVTDNNIYIRDSNSNLYILEKGVDY